MYRVYFGSGSSYVQVVKFETEEDALDHARFRAATYPNNEYLVTKEVPIHVLKWQPPVEGKVVEKGAEGIKFP